MRVSVIYFAPKQHEKARSIARELVYNLQKENHQVDMFDINDNRDIRLTMYEYIIILGETLNNWSNKISSDISQFFSQSSTINGKRATALLLSPFLWKRRALLNIMKILESEGMIVNYSSVVSSTKQIMRIASAIPIKHA